MSEEINEEKEVVHGFHPDTIIWTVEGQKKISEITEPVKVYARGDYGIDYLMIGPAYESGESETLTFTLSNGSKITVSPETKLDCGFQGWVAAKYLEPREKIVIFTDDMLVERSIKSIKKNEEPIKLWAVPGSSMIIGSGSGFCVKI